MTIILFVFCASWQNNYQPTQEFGLRTRADGFGLQVFIPCIDLIGRPSREKIVELLEGLNGLLGDQTFWIYDSGRSFHIYTEAMISPMKNKRFMSLLKSTQQ
jgi:hypothetical protein